jgi:hypothetical protein
LLIRAAIKEAEAPLYTIFQFCHDTIPLYQ